jgi:hypothetical protein
MRTFSAFSGSRAYKKHLKQKNLLAKTMTEEARDCFIDNLRHSRVEELTKDDEEEVREVLQKVWVNSAGLISRDGKYGTYKYRDVFKIQGDHKVKGYTIVAFTHASAKCLAKLQEGNGGQIVTHHFHTLLELQQKTRWNNEATLKKLRNHPANLRLLLKVDHDSMQCELEKRIFKNERDHVPVTNGEKNFSSLKEMVEDPDYSTPTATQLNSKAAALTIKADKMGAGVAKPAGVKWKDGVLYSSAPHAFSNDLAMDRVGEEFKELDRDALQCFTGDNVDDAKLDEFINRFQVSTMGRVRQSSPGHHLTHLVMLKVNNSNCTVCSGDGIGNCGMRFGRRSAGPPRHGSGWGEQSIHGDFKLRLPTLLAVGLLPETVKKAFKKVDGDKTGVKVKVKQAEVAEEADDDEEEADAMEESDEEKANERKRPILKTDLIIRYRTSKNSWATMRGDT